MSGKHDKLQGDCFRWMWNEFPNLRRLFWHTVNSHPAWRKREISILKGIGLVKGVTDLVFYYKSRLHVFDIKIGGDKLSKEQLEFMDQVKVNGGESYEIRSVEQFKEIIYAILGE